MLATFADKNPALKPHVSCPPPTRTSREPSLKTSRSPSPRRPTSDCSNLPAAYDVRATGACPSSVAVFTTISQSFPQPIVESHETREPDSSTPASP